MTETCMLQSFLLHLFVLFTGTAKGQFNSAHLMFGTSQDFGLDAAPIFLGSAQYPFICRVSGESSPTISMTATHTQTHTHRHRHTQTHTHTHTDTHTHTHTHTIQRQVNQQNLLGGRNTQHLLLYTLFGNTRQPNSYLSSSTKHCSYSTVGFSVDTYKTSGHVFLADNM